MSPSSSSHANAEAIISAVDLLSSSNNVRTWLSLHHPKQLATLDLFELELRRGRLSMPASSAVVGSTFSCVQNGRISDQQGMEADRRLITSRTVELLKVLIGQTKWRTGAQLLILLRGLGEELHSAGGFRDPAIGNVVRRIMRCVREEVVTISATSIPLSADDDGDVGPRRRRGLLATKTAPTPKSTTAITDSSGRTSLANMLWAHPQHIVPLKKSMSNITTGAGGSIGAGAGSNASENRRIRSESAGSSSSSSILDHRGRSAGGSQQDCHMSLGTSLPPSFHVNRSDLRQAVMEAIQEVQSELEDVHTVINDQATSHIHADEVILIYGRSKTVELFLEAAAAKNRQFQVVICEGAPYFGGHFMARSLVDAGIETLVINDSAVFAFMARVNKVLLPAHAVLANGGLVTSSGSHMVALAAKENAVPVVCITGMFKLCPRYPHEGQDTLNDLVSPSFIMDYSAMSNPLLSDVELINPVHDYIPPNLIDLYVTNIGGFQPSYIYRLLAEYYHIDDWESFE